MSDDDCVRFLQQTLPRARLRWAGFRKVRRQVCRRLKRRQKELGLAGFADYADFLDREPAELEVFDSLCRIAISRFYRDRGVFDHLRERVLPALAEQEDRRGIYVWSAGCASGEEPYTMSVMWRMELAVRYPGLRFSVLATDADDTMLGRARAARYPAGCLKDLPDRWKDAAFAREGGDFVLRSEFGEGVVLERQDIRREMPGGPFDIVLCRNLVFTYFDDGLQRRLLAGILERIRPGGFLVIGKHERLPGTAAGLSPDAPGLGVFRYGVEDDYAPADAARAPATPV